MAGGDATGLVVGKTQGQGCRVGVRMGRDDPVGLLHRRDVRGQLLQQLRAARGVVRHPDDDAAAVAGHHRA
jgi:hypothetical protein